MFKAKLSNDDMFTYMFTATIIYKRFINDLMRDFALCFFHVFN